MAILIKRYANRKLYNTETSKYITLKGITALIEEGHEVQVIDKETGEDITSVALSQILVDSERSNTTIPNSLFSQLMERGGDAIVDTLRRGVTDASDGLGALQDRVRRAIQVEDSDAKKIRDWIPDPSQNLDRVIQNAVERVFKVLDLPRKADIEDLNRNLEQIAKAVQKLEKSSKKTPDED